jgi:hypothetical protein
MGDLVCIDHPSRNIKVIYQMFGSLQNMGFTLMEEKVTLRASKIKYLGHLVFLCGQIYFQIVHRLFIIS